VNDEDHKLIRRIVAEGGRKYTAGNIDRRKYDRLVALGFLTAAADMSDIEYRVTETGRAAAVEDGKFRLSAAQGEEVSELKTGFAGLGLNNAIRMRWVLRDIVAKRLSPIAPNDLQTLIELGFVEMNDEVPTVTITGLDQIAIGVLPSVGGRAEGEK
jgi:hypothetical protein